jgi:MoxR-like ATPase
LRARFPECQDFIDGSLAALLCGEHVLLLGPPGTAKSALVRALAHAFEGVLFERHLSRKSTPEELLGPPSLSALDEGRLIHITTGMLPDAHLALVGNVFTASSSVLNLLLSLMDERVFLYDGAPVSTPLISLFGTTTMLPEDGAQEILFDRFLLRFELEYLQRPSSLRAVLTSPEPAASTTLGMEALRAIQETVARVKLTEDTLETLLALRDALKDEGVVASDRRWNKSLRLLQAAACLTGEEQTSPETLTTLVDVLWRHPCDQPRVARVVGRLVNPVAFQASEVLEAARETVSRAQALKARHRRAYLAQAAQALVELRAQIEMLVRLSESASRRARSVVEEAISELNELHAVLTRDVHAAQGLKLLR